MNATHKSEAPDARDLNVERGCELLAQSLRPLSARIAAVQTSVAAISGCGTGRGKGGVESSFTHAATYVADTLGDVSDRLRRVNALLGELMRRG